MALPGFIFPVPIRGRLHQVSALFMSLVVEAEEAEADGLAVALPVEVVVVQ